VTVGAAAAWHGREGRGSLRRAEKDSGAGESGVFGGSGRGQVQGCLTPLARRRRSGSSRSLSKSRWGYPWQQGCPGDGLRGLRPGRAGVASGHAKGGCPDFSFCTWIGQAEHVEWACERNRQRWARGIRACRRLFPSWTLSALPELRYPHPI